MAVMDVSPLTIALGTRDPLIFIKRFANTYKPPLVAVINRTRDRTRFRQWSWPDPRRAGGKLVIDMGAKTSMSSTDVALRVALWAMKAPAIFGDEMVRYSMGLPRGFDGGSDGQGPWELFDPRGTIRHAGGGSEEGEPLTFAVIAAVAVPILIVIIPIVLPFLLEAGKAAIEKLGPVVEDVASGAGNLIGGIMDQKPPPAPTPDPEPEWKRWLSDPLVWGAAAAVGALAFFVLKK